LRGSATIERKRAVQAPVFAALGDETRLGLVAKLAGGTPLSIAQLSEGATVTRQAITKHLRVLEGAGLVSSARAGRESQFRLEPEPLEEARRYLELVSAAWDQALDRLKAFVET
jgi:DNA-binding transcriptional ArsR family regulator